MRVSREVMIKHRQDILAAANRMFKQRGIDGTSVAEVMQAAGLTHGGFYRHFSSKEALVAEAMGLSFEAMAADLAQKREEIGPKAALREFIAGYLTIRHVRAPGEGCPVAAIGAEAGRAGEAVREVFAQGVRAFADLVASCLEGEAQDRRQRALRLLAGLAGAVVMARSVGDDSLAQEILLACQQEVERQPNLKLAV